VQVNIEITLLFPCEICSILISVKTEISFVVMAIQQPDGPRTLRYRDSTAKIWKIAYILEIKITGFINRRHNKIFKTVYGAVKPVWTEFIAGSINN
jgi:hypothetical protein